MPKQTKSTTAADYIVPLNMNGLQGRMLHMPAPKAGGREILLLYGHHSSLERWFGMAQVLNKYGSVTMPDLPGFGGMQSFYKIGQKPSLDNLADYLAAFVKMRYKRRRVTIVGMSFSFLIVTRMLQRCPDLAKKVDILVSILGFAHKDDLMFSRSLCWQFRIGAAVVSQPVIHRIVRVIGFNQYALRWAYTKNGHSKFKGAEPQDVERLLQIEMGLWRDNDIRTWAYTTRQLLTVNNLTKPINLPVWHVGTSGDHLLDHMKVEQHFRRVFTDFEGAIVNMQKHAPTVMAEAKDVLPFVPPKLRRALAQKP